MNLVSHDQRVFLTYAIVLLFFFFFLFVTEEFASFFFGQELKNLLISNTVYMGFLLIHRLISLLFTMLSVRKKKLITFIQYTSRVCSY